MFVNSFLRFVVLITILKTIDCQEALCVVNGKKSLNVVDDHFISYALDFNSIRNNILVRGLPSVSVAKNLHPALIRIPNFFSKKTSFHNLTLVKWEKLNTWLRDSNLIPIFLLNGEFLPNEHSLFPYFVANFKNKFICYWELHYDFGEITRERLENDLSTFNGIWEKYPSLKKYLKIVASSSTSGSFSENDAVLQEVLGRLNYSSDTVIYESRLLNGDSALSSHGEDGESIWFTLEDDNTLSSSPFDNSLRWLQQIEDIAISGYTTVFKRESFDHLFANTPEYWISTIYKSVIDTNVLEVQSNIPSNATTRVYAHCSKIQQGAMGLVVVNNNFEKNTVMLKIPQPHFKNLEIHSYILTSTDKNSKHTYLNGEKLEFGFLIRPKIDNLRINNHMISIQLPKKSVGIFVLFGTRIPACLQNDQPWARTFNEISDKLVLRKPQPFKPHKPKDWLKHLDTSNENPSPTSIFKIDAPTVKVEVVYSEKATSAESTKPVTKIELQLTKDEIRQILINRAKTKAAEQNISMTDDEFKDQMKDAFGNFNKRTKRDINMELLQRNSERQMHSRKLPRRPSPREEVDLGEVDDRMEFMMGDDFKNKHFDPENNFDRSSRFRERDERPNKHVKFASRADEDDIDKRKLDKAIRTLENYLRDSNGERSEEDYYESNEYRRRFKRGDSFGERWRRNKDRKLHDNLSQTVSSSEDRGVEILETNVEKGEEPRKKTHFNGFNNFFSNMFQELKKNKSKRRENLKKNKSSKAQTGSSREDYFNRRKRTNNDERSRNIEKNIRAMSFKLRRDGIKKRLLGLNEDKFNPWSLFSKRKVKREIYDDVDSSENAIEVDVKSKFDFDRDDFKKYPEVGGNGTTSTTLETDQVTVSQCVTEKTEVKENTETGSGGQDIFDSISNTIKKFFVNLYNEVANYFR